MTFFDVFLKNTCICRCVLSQTFNLSIESATSDGGGGTATHGLPNLSQNATTILSFDELLHLTDSPITAGATPKFLPTSISTPVRCLCLAFPQLVYPSALSHL